MHRRGATSSMQSPLLRLRALKIQPMVWKKIVSRLPLMKGMVQLRSLASCKHLLRRHLDILLMRIKNTTVRIFYYLLFTVFSLSVPINHYCASTYIEETNAGVGIPASIVSVWHRNKIVSFLAPG